MKKILYIAVLTAVVLLIPGEAAAQHAGVNFSLAFPRGNFYANNKSTGIGGGVDAVLVEAVQGGVRFGIGANLGFYTYGGEGREAAFSKTIPDVSVDVDRSYNLTNFHLLMRLSTNNTLVRPYVDVLLGGTYLYTSTTVTNQHSGEEVTSSTNFDDAAWSYGAGAGFLVKVYENKEEDGWGPIYVDFKVRYLAGTEADYIKKGGVEVDDNNGKVYYHITTSKTDILSAHLGVTIPFSFSSLSNLQY